MASPILGTPKPAFFNSSGAPLVSGTLTIQDPDDASAKSWYTSEGNANGDVDGSTATITLDSRGEPPNPLFGRDNEDYRVILKDSAGSTLWSVDVTLPPGTGGQKVKTADESLGTTTLADDTHLKTFNLNANTYYKMTGYLLAAAAGATQDLKIVFQLDNAAQDSAYSWITVDSGSALTVDEGETQALTTEVSRIDIDGTGDVGIILTGFIFTNASSTTAVDLQVAQGTDAGSTTLKNGSWIKFEPILT